MDDEQRVNLYQPILADRVGPAPLVLRVGVVPQADHLVGGVPQTAMKAESYVLLSALPEELKARVELAIQMIASAI